MKKYIIYSTLFIMILGTLLHFTYDWSNQNPIVASFSAINESTWEHLKLVFFPMLLTTIVGYFLFGKNVQNFLCANILGIITAISFIVIFFYTYTGIIGTNFAILDIGSFFVSILLGEFVIYKVLNSNLKCNKYLAITAFILLLFCFIFFSYFPPKLGLFEDPLAVDNLNLIN